MSAPPATPKPANRERLRAILGPDLARFADRVPEMMAQELVRGDHGFIAPYQLSEALLSRLRADMQDWTTPDVLRTLAPNSPLARNRMQAVAGGLAAMSCRAYPAFSYYPYLPFGPLVAGACTAPLIVAVHGSSRNPKDLRDAYAAFAERLGCVVLAPLFPLDLTTSVPDEEYKQLIGDRLRYDHVLWAMIDELAAITSMRFSKILLFGFSGDAQFAQRLFYVAPERLGAVSLGAPSYVTLPNAKTGWWVGIGDVEARFGRAIDFDAMRRVPVQLLCGGDDDLDAAIYRAEEIGLDPHAYAALGRNRQDRIALLHDAYGDHGILCETSLIEGVGHACGPLLTASQPFFERVLVAD